MAAARAAASAYGLSLYRYLGGINARCLPLPMMNVVNGGAHAANNLDIQEFMIIPTKAKTFFEAARWICETYHTLKKEIKSRFGVEATNVGGEGGFAPPLNKTEQALFLLEEAIKNSGYGRKIRIAIEPDKGRNMAMACKGSIPVTWEATTPKKLLAGQ